MGEYVEGRGGFGEGDGGCLSVCLPTSLNVGLGSLCRGGEQGRMRGRVQGLMSE